MKNFTEKQQEYYEKLKNPKWQKKRLEILERDNWTCQNCSGTSKELNVHHKIYYPNYEPWDYPNDLLITYCKDCHELDKNWRNYFEDALINLLRKHCTFNSLQILVYIIKYLPSKFDKIFSKTTHALILKNVNSKKWDI
jgi:hypothetical protein